MKCLWEGGWSEGAVTDGSRVKPMSVYNHMKVKLVR